MRFQILVLMLPLLCLCGCGPAGPELAEVSGTVTLDGQPLPGFIVNFIPVEKGTTSSGITDETGQYRLMFTRDRSGVLLGEHHVTFEAMPLDDQPKNRVRLPRKYTRTGELTATVQRGANSIDLDLASSL